MSSEKEKLSESLKTWLESYLNQKYSKDYDITVLIPSSNISKLPDPNIKKNIKNYGSLEFSPDILGILKEKKNDHAHLILLNRSTSPITLKEIGEMQCYCRLADPLEAFIISIKGLPQEINILLINDPISKSLLNYNNKNIVVFTWDMSSNTIDPLSTFPLKS